MKKNLAIYITALALFATLAIPVQLAAQGKQANHHKHHHYQLVDIGTFGGPQSYTFASFSIQNNSILNNRGTLAGLADTSTPDPFPNFCFNDCYVSHAFQWQDDGMTDLGALPGGSSSASVFVSASGLVAGLSQNGKVDPLFPGFPEARAVLWNHGKIRNLGTLEGGYESAAAAVNSQGQVVGGSLNTVPDANAMILFGHLPTNPVSSASVSMATRWDAGSGNSPRRHRRPSGADQQLGTGSGLVLYQLSPQRGVRSGVWLPLDHRLFPVGQQQWNGGSGQPGRHLHHRL